VVAEERLWIPRGSPPPGRAPSPWQGTPIDERVPREVRDDDQCGGAAGDMARPARGFRAPRRRFRGANGRVFLMNAPARRAASLVRATGPQVAAAAAPFVQRLGHFVVPIRLRVRPGSNLELPSSFRAVPSGSSELPKRSAQRAASFSERVTRSREWPTGYSKPPTGHTTQPTGGTG
jgi:hypothetical protein